MDAFAISCSSVTTLNTWGPFQLSHNSPNLLPIATRKLMNNTYCLAHPCRAAHVSSSAHSVDYLQSLIRSTTSFYLPRFDMPFPLRCHPDYEFVREQINQYILAIERPQNDQRKQEIVQARYPLLCCHAFPDAELTRILELNKLMYWLLTADDRVDDEDGMDSESTKQLVDKHITFLEGRQYPERENAAQEEEEEKCLVSLKNVWEEMQLTPVQRERLKNGIDFFLTSSQRQSLLREQRAVVTIDEYVQMRRSASSSIVWLLMVEYGVGVEIDDEAYKHPAIQRLHDACSDFVSFSNDLYSFRKEFYNSDFYNLPSVICMSRRCSLQEAMLESRDILKEVAQHYRDQVKVIQRVPFLMNKPGMQRYLDGLGYCLSGSTYWCWTSARYHGLDWMPATLPPEGTLHLQPQRTVLRPPPENPRETSTCCVVTDCLV